MPPGSTIITQPTDKADLIQVFVTSREELVHELADLKKIKLTAILWVMYPKGTSKIKTDINGDSIARYAATIG